MLERAEVLEDAWSKGCSGEVKTDLHVFHFPAQLATEFDEWLKIRQKHHHAYPTDLGVCDPEYSAEHLTSIASHYLFSCVQTSKIPQEDKVTLHDPTRQGDNESQSSSDDHNSIVSLPSSQDFNRQLRRRRHSCPGPDSWIECTSIFSHNRS